MANLIVQNVRQEQTGVATGMNAVTRTLGGAFGGQLAATLLASELGAGGLPTSTGFTLSFMMCLIALAGAFGLAVAVPRRGANGRAAAGGPAPPRPRAAAGPPGARGASRCCRIARGHRRNAPRLDARPRPAAGRIEFLTS